MTTATSYSLKDLPKTYRKLVDLFPLRPIRNEDDYETALAIVLPLVRGEGETTRDQEDYMDVLADLIAAYEREHYHIPDGSPIDVLKYLMDDRGMSANDLGRLLGSKSLGSLILNGRRQLSKAHIRKLTAHFGVSADLLL